jgi:predicted acetyltransferase
MSTYLRKPTYKDEASYIDFLKELIKTSEYPSTDDAQLREIFVKFMYELPLKELGLIEPDRLMPQITYFLVDEHEDVIGILHLRLSLNEELFMYNGHIGYQIRPSKRRQGYGHEILRLGLEMAKELEFKEILVTSNEENVASHKIILKQGGILENKVFKTDGYIFRYWIKLS